MHFVIMYIMLSLKLLFNSTKLQHIQSYLNYKQAWILDITIVRIQKYFKFN